ncbi:MAG: DUF2188 domain-containing protein [Methylococcales bacterium]
MLNQNTIYCVFLNFNAQYILFYLEDFKMPNNDRYVVRHPDGWAVKKGGAERASDVFGTQKEAERRAKEIV